MTTLYGSTLSLWKHAEGCVPLKGMVASARDSLKFTPLLFRAILTLSIDRFDLGSSSWIRVRGRLIRASDQSNQRSDQRDMDLQVVTID
ncbi:hypothetical protein VitviT2T_023083 [Vitis vinifera]|uniref:Uncharacterized protein n=1 Tax=Vitis vinifera TaxID=29760 RepID=A0ABY9DDH5_VITVI|nr:hypothetical protein VitviT2T_023083 [Vitis vinifera]